MRTMALLFAVAAAALALAASIQLRCAADRRLLELEQQTAEAKVRDEELLSRVANIDGALRKAFPDVTMIRWWCHAGRGACFRDRGECIRRHAQGIAGCEPRRIAYCVDETCYGELAVCQDGSAARRLCAGVE